MRFNILNIFLSIPALLIAFTIREYTRAKIADKLGDKTPRFQGRLTLDPFAHIDILGFILMILCGFGWSKPVQINKNAFKKYRKDALKVSISAWLSNLVVAIIAAIIYVVFIKIFGNSNSSSIVIIRLIIQYIIILNVNLFVFNILPLPGLDGFRIFEDLYPRTFYKFADKIYQYYNLILLIVILFGSSILSIPSNIVMSFIQSIINFLL